MRLAELAAVIPLRVVRDAEFRSLGLLSHRSPAMLACLHDARARLECESNADLSCVITSPDLAPLVPDHIGMALTTAPRDRFFDVQNHLGSSTDFYGTDEPTHIAPEARIDSGAIIAQRNVRIGAGCVVEGGAIVLARTTLEPGAIIRSGAVVGAEGFHPVPYAGGTRNLPHFGAVHVGTQVEIQANTVVCRSVFHNATRIGAQTLLGPLVYVAHGVRIGDACRVAASARLTGSSVIGDRVYIGPNAVISNQVRIGDDARVTLGAVVVRDVEPGQTVSGHFAVEHSRFLREWSRRYT
jgi:UDP-3-O-[3-hydroxymyristoyl] glucosamine N-acyltransferase